MVAIFPGALPCNHPSGHSPVRPPEPPISVMQTQHWRSHSCPSSPPPTAPHRAAAVAASREHGGGGVVASKSANGFYSGIGGACIARSTDFGKSFTSYQCIHQPAYDFYDGGHMASGPNGDIYAAYVDVSTSKVDIW